MTDPITQGDAEIAKPAPFQHGVNCPKVPHDTRLLYSHEKDDDSIFQTVWGWRCGRCHAEVSKPDIDSLRGPIEGPTRQGGDPYEDNHSAALAEAQKRVAELEAECKELSRQNRVLEGNLDRHKIKYESLVRQIESATGIVFTHGSISKFSYNDCVPLWDVHYKGDKIATQKHVEDALEIFGIVMRR